MLSSAPVRALTGLACILTVAGCFDPDAREGLSCTSEGDCPPGQDCHPVAGGPGMCLSAPPGDGGIAADGGLAFGAPEMIELQCGSDACLSPRDPTLIENRTQILFTVDSLNAAGDRDVYLANRPTAFEPFLPAAPAGAIDTITVEEGGWVTANGLRLYFTRADQNMDGPPYGDLWVSDRLATTDPFDAAAPVAGVVNTSQGDERAAVGTVDGNRLVFARALGVDPADHDVYLALESGEQWDTVARVDVLAVAGEDEHSVAMAEATQSLFVGRGDRIVEARWSGGFIAGAALVAVHDELVVAEAERVSGLWAAPDGSEIWFGACGDTCAIYRAVR